MSSPFPAAQPGGHRRYAQSHDRQACGPTARRPRPRHGHGGRSPTPDCTPTRSTASPRAPCSRPRATTPSRTASAWCPPPGWPSASGVNPAMSSGFQGIGQMPGSVALAVNAIASGAADYVLVHRALHNPAGSYHGNPMRQAAGPLQWTAPQGFFGPLAMIGLHLQRVPPALRRLAAMPWRPCWSRRARTAPASRGRTGTTAARAPRSTWTSRCSPIRSAVWTATSRWTASRPSSSPRPSGHRICHTGPSTSRATPAAAPPGAGCRSTGPSTISTMPAARPAGRLWEDAGSARRGRPAPALRRLLAVRLPLARGPRFLPGR